MDNHEKVIIRINSTDKNSIDQTLSVGPYLDHVHHS